MVAEVIDCPGAARRCFGAEAEGVAGDASKRSSLAVGVRLPALSGAKHPPTIKAGIPRAFGKLGCRKILQAHAGFSRERPDMSNLHLFFTQWSTGALKHAKVQMHAVREGAA